MPDKHAKASRVKGAIFAAGLLGSFAGLGLLVTARSINLDVSALTYPKASAGDRMVILPSDIALFMPQRVGYGPVGQQHPPRGSLALSD